MKTKTIKEKVAEIIYKGIPFVCSEEIYHEVATKIDKLYRKELFASSDKKSVNEMPPMILDDDIADWEHDNLVKNG